MSSDELVVFLDDGEEPPVSPVERAWKVAIIDDEPAVHDGTRFALYDYSLNGQGIEIISAHSAEEGRRLVLQHPDLAVILLDVVMETDSAGLDLVDFIRNTLKNDMVRIILRTGQPGQAPERRVIVDYDINDYKAKTELTADKLFTALTAALRSYQQLQRMEETRRGLEIIIDAAARLFNHTSMQQLAEGVLTQIGSLLKVDCAGILVLRDSQGQGARGDGYAVIAGSGVYRDLVVDPKPLSADLKSVVDQAFQVGRHQFLDRRSVLYLRTGSGREVVAVLEAEKDLSDTDRALVEVFCGKLAIAFDNVILYEQIAEANRTLERRVAERTRDLTAANERLALQREILKRANSFKSDILGMVAHDLKNPISVILGRAEIIAELIDRDPVPADMIRNQLTRIVEPAQSMTRMIEQLLKDAMNDQLDVRLRPDTVDLVALVEDVVEDYRPMAQRKQQTLTVEAASPVRVEADPDRLREALENLISNAIKYGPIGGPVLVRLEAGGDEVRLSVIDRGPGLSPEDLGRLFGRFQRLSAKPTGGEGSTGLGLSIAKHIVALHGGKIQAYSAGPGQGTTFAIHLPLRARGEKGPEA
ncbi:ATP-binding response regulator [Prosthecomicrobium sp. N25]|uniref:ATP-binding response regulator n=1 Tax=Prosthecomicrobium sp. N25 TaxID=3129254 RepID=UPI0030782439